MKTVFAFAVVVLLSIQSFAVELTQDQLVTFGNHIRANSDQNVIDAVAAGDVTTIQQWYSDDSSLYVFLDSVSTDDVRESIVWSEVLDPVDGMDELQRWGFDLMMANGTFNPEKVNTRNGLILIFDAQMPLTRAAIIADATRFANEFETIFGVAAIGPGGGNGSTPSNAAIAVVKGTPSIANVDHALAATAP